MGKSSGPSAPDPYATAAAQSAANKEAIQESAKINAIDRFTPTGSVTYDKGEDGIPTAQRVTLTDQAQGIFDAQQGLSQKVADAAGGLADYLPTTPIDTSGVDGSKIAQTLFDRKMGLVRPELDQAREMADTRLVERGIPVGSEIYTDEMDRLDRAESQTLESLSNDAVLAGTSEEQRQLGNLYTQRNQGINEISAALRGSAALPMPSAPAPAQYQVAPPDISGLIQSNYQQQANAAASRNNSINQGLFGLGAMLI